MTPNRVSSFFKVGDRLKNPQLSLNRAVVMGLHVLKKLSNTTWAQAIIGINEKKVFSPAMIDGRLSLTGQSPGAPNNLGAGPIRQVGSHPIST
jgi:hypothetical protein